MRTTTTDAVPGPVDSTPDVFLDEAWAPESGCWEPIPAGLDRMAPGPVLAALLTSIDVRRISGHDRVTVLRAQRRMASFFEAQALESMTSIVDAYDTELGHAGDGATEGAAAEIRVSLHLTRRAADRDLALALALRRRLPAVGALLAEGVIDLPRARVMVFTTEHLPVVSARRVVAAVVDEAPHLTTGQLAARIRRLCLEVDPDGAACRYRDAVTHRRIVTQPTPDGTVDLLGLDLPPDRVAAATDRIEALARSLRRDGETRTMDQLRADVTLDLLCGTGTAHAAHRGRIDLRVDLTTLMELAEHPGDLAGYGPVCADLARRIVADRHDTEWTYTVTHQGRPVATGTTRRRPTTGQRRLARARETTCTFPGCRMPAAACDLDHRVPWAEGHRTDLDDLAPRCRHDHLIRHRFRWTDRRLPDGRHRWTSPLGHTTITPPRPP